MTQLDPTAQAAEQAIPDEEEKQLPDQTTSDAQPDEEAPTETQDEPDDTWEEQAADVDSDRIFEEDLAAIKAKYPFVTQEHVSQLGVDFIKIMAGGNADAVKAFELTHTDDIIEHRVREEARKLYSKSHLHRVQGGADMSTDVPKEVYRQYKRLLPGVSDAEIRRHYLSSLDD